MITTYKAAPDIDVLTTNFPVPGFGLVPINAFVLHGAEPVLVDTGTVVDRAGVHGRAALGDRSVRAAVDLAEPHGLRPHRVVAPLLDENPRLSVITTFLGVGIMGLSAPLPMERVHLLNPGQSITAGGRTLTAVKPPMFDNPVTTGFYDDLSGALFSCRLLRRPAGRGSRTGGGSLRGSAPAGPGVLGDGRLPVVVQGRPGLFARDLDAVRAFEPSARPEQPPPGRVGRFPGTHDHHPGGGAGGRAVRRSRPGSAGTDAGVDGGSVRFVTARTTIG